MMRRLILAVLLCLSIVVHGQDRTFTMRAGYSAPFAPYGVWSDDITSLYANNDFNFYPGDGYGLTFDNEMPSDWAFLFYRFGAFYNYAGRYDGYEDDNQISEAWLDLTGFGVYGGLTFRGGWKNFGVYSNVSAGFFSFDYRAQLQYTSKMAVAPLSDNVGESVSGPGGKFEAGLWGSWKGIMVCPSFQFLGTSRGSQTILIKSFNLSAGYAF